jgi:hypothetical protein
MLMDLGMDVFITCIFSIMYGFWNGVMKMEDSQMTHPYMCRDLVVGNHVNVQFYEHNLSYSNIK